MATDSGENSKLSALSDGVSAREARFIKRLNSIKERRLKESNKENSAFAKRLDSGSYFIGDSKITEIRLKEAELDYLLTIEKLKHRLLEEKENLERAVRDRREAERALAEEEEIRKRRLVIDGRIEELKEKIDEVSEKLTAETAAESEARRKLSEIKEESGIRKPAVSASLPAVKKYEKYDRANIIEIRDVYFKRKGETEFLLKGLNLSVKRERITVFYSESKEKLVWLRQVLNKSYGSDVRVVRGIVRIDGKETGGAPRDEFKETFGKYMISLSQIYGILGRAKGKLKGALRGICDDGRLKAFCALFGYTLKGTNVSVLRFTSEELSDIALAAVFASGRDVSIVDFPEEYLQKGALAELISYLNKPSRQNAALIMTTDIKLAGAIEEAKVYKI